MYFVDDTFTAIPSRVRGFIKQINKFNYKIKWTCESRINVMNDEIIKEMARASCGNIQYGIESGSQCVLDKIRKNIDLEIARKVIDDTYKAGISFALSFIFGHYCDTKETMEETVDMIEELYQKYEDKIGIYISYNTPFPGTWQYINRDELGLKIRARKYSQYTLLQPIVETNNFSLEDQRDVL